MGIFTRMRDIVSSNINAMLDKAEDPEKLIKLMIQEMEDTLVEVKASCAGTIATGKRIDRDLVKAEEGAQLWAERAELAVARGREGLAREAIRERQHLQEKVTSLEREQADCGALIEQYKNDIGQLEDKLRAAREKHRTLIRRHVHAQRKDRAQRGIRRTDNSDAWVRFEQFENRIERMEAEADLINPARRPDLDTAFSELDGDEDVEKELEALRQKLAGNSDDTPVEAPPVEAAS
ncbi:MAG: phage shock protein PspA [Lentisphaerae bacterium]|jgi:phage shock protein A|nr:phage shock protein PspA [Lentisphaerota bacterium]MBT4817210.1 phage shock protein PspA [Lentisphaerota bacterium]MBT5608194.1 phage shock protein PspA [Lentisphaerota bacterium]MBT7058917.1 phage shock protein PspA [Lentisphaerota bacterium]MBT7842852.1 phage shock protein PspA [Lentisphaerota bacterium]